MAEYIYWRGSKFALGKTGKCPRCGRRTVCWEHSYMVQGYANFIKRIRVEEGVDPVKGGNTVVS